MVDEVLGQRVKECAFWHSQTCFGNEQPGSSGKGLTPAGVGVRFRGFKELSLKKRIKAGCLAPERGTQYTGFQYLERISRSIAERNIRWNPQTITIHEAELVRCACLESSGRCRNRHVV